MSKAITPDKWKWYGHAGHFICGHKCRFHLCTEVGKYLVSTVGELPKFNDKMDGFERLGAGPEIYETMVFEAGKRCTDKDCNCGLPTISGLEIHAERYMTAAQATAGHYEFCREMAKS